MGWSGGTVIFDGVLEVVMEYIHEDAIDEVLYALWDLLTDQDWDTYTDSNYYDLLEPVLRKRGVLDDGNERPDD